MPLSSRWNFWNEIRIQLFNLFHSSFCRSFLPQKVLNLRAWKPKIFLANFCSSLSFSKINFGDLVFDFCLQNFIQTSLNILSGWLHPWASKAVPIIYRNFWLTCFVQKSNKNYNSTSGFSNCIGVPILVILSVRQTPLCKLGFLFSFEQHRLQLRFLSFLQVKIDTLYFFKQCGLTRLMIIFYSSLLLNLPLKRNWLGLASG